MDTIFALATVRGKAGVSIIRISGADAFTGVRCLLKTDLPQPRQSALRKLYGEDGELIDQALLLAFDKDHSFTGEQTVELHIHGSPAVQTMLLNHLSTLNGFRIADPGEFTRRALENGRLDLSRVEGLADLINAETEAQRKQAMRLFSGELAEKSVLWRTKLIRAAALMQATIDFADEEVPEDVSSEVLGLLRDVISDLDHQVKGYAASERIRSGFEVAIVGRPNVGKSTLLNALARRDAAITSHIPGTTRDIVEVQMDLNGLPVTVIDTAGLRETADEIETIGIDRAKRRASDADLRVFLIDPEDEIQEVTQHADDIVVIGKGDLRPIDGLSVSGKTGAGLNQLIDLIVKALEGRTQGAGLAVRERHRVAVEDTIAKLDSAVLLIQKGEQYTDLSAEELRSAIHSISSIIGIVDVEDILDEVFSSFCLGK
ncbi:tRNA uridine-5-carboxymethylaminomethyl(34) synthesis GTPase MnmE [Pseudaestuariivita rosea]|uniref:tRNA uridine-5-carboxymethylaminomethyl(34) synthesis GTPase MnmE n=1 Tax=Pseudaestuariivita rosea TaxID=2763263 RepID=UPI001ABB87C4|nr:tRNA uridine-5-carboxymethylaminomethyl(34) synthesis GTPase MnmE [Pseudaestuariivita rosea]